MQPDFVAVTDEDIDRLRRILHDVPEGYDVLQIAIPIPEDVVEGRRAELQEIATDAVMDALQAATT